MSTKATFDVLKWIVSKGHTDLCPKYWGDPGECECGLDNARDSVAELLKKGQQPMTTERSGMSLEQVRDDLSELSHKVHHPYIGKCRQMADAIDAHLSRDAVVSSASFSTVSAVVMALSRVGHAAPESQEEQAARFESLVIDLCRQVESRYDLSKTFVSEADALGLIDGLNMMANSSDSTGHDSEAEFLRCCAHVIHQSFAARHAAVPDVMKALYEAASKGFHTSETCGPDNRYCHVSKFRSFEDLHAFSVAWTQTMLAQRDGGN